MSLVSTLKWRCCITGLTGVFSVCALIKHGQPRKEPQVVVRALLQNSWYMLVLVTIGNPCLSHTPTEDSFFVCKDRARPAASRKANGRDQNLSPFGEFIRFRQEVFV